MSILDKKVDEIEEPVYSLDKQKEIKQKEFRQYLVDKNVVLAFVKLLLALRSSSELPENPIEVIRDYFGEASNPEWDENARLKSDIDQLKEENQALLDEITDLQNKKIEVIELKKQRELEKQQKLAEEEAKKTSKKGAKKQEKQYC